MIIKRKRREHSMKRIEWMREKTDVKSNGSFLLVTKREKKKNDRLKIFFSRRYQQTEYIAYENDNNH
jgi:hypothetical protein